MTDRRVAITGLGVISSIGLGKEAFWSALLEGKSGIRPIQSFDASSYSSQFAGEIADFRPDQVELTLFDATPDRGIGAVGRAFPSEGRGYKFEPSRVRQPSLRG